MLELQGGNAFEAELDAKIKSRIEALVDKKKTYQAEVIRKDSEGIWWVKFPGNDDETPVMHSTVDMNVGDYVTVVLEDHVTMATGDLTNPPLSTANTIGYVDKEIEPARDYVTALVKNDVQADNIVAANAYITSLVASDITTQTLVANKAYIDDLEASNITAQTLSADHATIENLDATYATIDNLEANYATIANLNAEKARITTLESDNIIVNNKITAAEGRIGTLESDNVTVNQKITAAEGDIALLKSSKADISYLESDYIKADAIEANYAQIDLANVNTAQIQNGLIQAAAIVDEQVFTVTGNKATLSEINADTITVRNLNAKNLKIETANGMVNVGGTQMPTKDYIDSLENTLQQEIDGAVETFTSTAVPLLSNYPASDWQVSGATAEEQRKAYAKHVGDICYVQNAASDQNGYAYRFAYDSTQQDFKWVLIKDSDVTKALSDISDLQTFESETSSWMLETDEGLRTIRENHTSLSNKVDKTLVESVQLWFTKADTTAPGKPAAHVATNNAATGNAWNIAVPTYNASYPNYYYCYEWKYSDGTYGWSSVTRDIAMGESQSLSRIAIKSSVMLWFTKANNTAPAKPSSQVTLSDASKGNQWNLVVPTYNASYPHYFYCYQQQKNDGTYQWTDVVYDRATSETQSTARATSSSLANYISSNDAALASLQDQVDGAVDIWYGSADPTASTAPWGSGDDQDVHVGDLYYNTENGHSFRYVKDGSTYSWVLLPDSDAAAALSAAQDAQATADGKRRIFTTTPTVPYDVGDLWVNGSTVKYASVKKTTGQAYSANDWSLTATDDTMAKSNIKSSVQLWFTKANSTAPAKPTSHVATNNAATGNAWNIAVPTYNASYPHYFYCYEYLKGDNTYAWSDVVYDKATTETMQKAQAALPQSTFTNFQQTTFKELVDEVDEQSSTISTLSSRVDQKADGSTVTTLSNTVNTVKQTADTNKTSITNLTTTTQTLRNDLDNLEVGGRNLLRWTSKPENTWTSWNSDPASSTGWGRWSTAWTVTDTDEGIKGTSANTKQSGFAIPLVSNNAVVGGEEYTLSFDYRTNRTSIGDIYLLCSTGGNVLVHSHVVTASTTDWKHYEQVIKWPSTSGKTTRALLVPYFGTVDDWFEIRGRSMKLEKGNKATDWSPAPEDVEASIAEVRITTTNKFNEVTETLDGVTRDIGVIQNDLTSKADGTTVSTLTTKVNNISDTVDGHTQQIVHVTKTANAQGTGTVDYSVMGIWEQGTTSGEAAGKTYEQMKANNNTRIRFESIMPITAGTYKVTITSGFHYLYETFDKDGKMVKISSWMSALEFDLSISVSEKYIVFILRKDTGSGNILPEEAEDSKLRITYEYASDSEFQETKTDYATFKQTVNQFQSTIGSTYATKTELSTEIKQTADSINLEVSKKVGANEIISKINQSPEEITIDADRIKINGTTIFSSNGTNTTLDNYLGNNYVSGQNVTTATDFNTFTSSGVYYIKNGSCANAPTANWGKLDVSVSGKTVQLFYPDALSYYYYRAKTGSTWSAWTKVDGVGAAATVQTNLDNLEVGGSNLLKGSMTLAVSETGKCGWMVNSQTPEIVTKDGYRCLHASASLGTTWTPSIRTRNRVLLEWGQEYRYSGYIMYDKAIKTLSSAPLHYHIGSVENLDEFNLSIMNKGGGVNVTQIEPGANVTIPANTWQRYVYKVQTAASAPNTSYPYPTIAPFIYGNVRTVSETDTVNMWAREFQIEKGSKVTSWRQASEDAESYADAAVESIPLHHNFATNYSYTASQLAGYAKEGHTTWWEITGSTTENVRVGDTVSLKITNSTTGKDAYLNGEVTQVNSSTRITVNAHGLSDTGASLLAENATAVVNVYPTAIDFVKGTATLAVSLCVGGAAKTPTSYKWTKGTAYTTSLGTGSTLAVTDLDAVYNCECTWS